MLGDNLRDLRKKRGITQEELANRLKVVRQTVSKWEKNLSVPDAQILQRISEILEVSPAQLLGAKMEAETEEDVDRLALQLARINEQLVIKNNRSRRIWKIVGVVLLSILAFYMVLLFLSVGLFRTIKKETTEVLEMETIIEENDQPGQP